MKKIVLIFIMFLITLSIYSYDFTLKSIQTDSNVVSVYRGKSMQTVKNENFLISMAATKNNHGIQFAASITNYSVDDYNFNENCITVYQGVYENNEWEQINYVPASIYYENEIKNAKTQYKLSAISLRLSAARAGHSTVNGYGYTNGYRYTYKANIYSPADASLAIANSYAVLDNMQKNNYDYLENLENNLLFDSLIPAGENYNGFFIVNEKKGPDYKVIFELSPNELFVFYFTRSDKEEILNPWKDKSRDRHSIVLGFSPTFNNFSTYYLWSRSKGVGVYTGIAYRSVGKNIFPYAQVFNIDKIGGYDLDYVDPKNVGYYNYDWKFDYDASQSPYSSFGYYAGMTIKTVPYTWLLLGIGVDFELERYYEGDLYYKVNKWNQQDQYWTHFNHCWISTYTFDVLFSPQIGVNFITNHLDFGCIATIPIGGNFNLDITIGYTF